MKKLTCIILAVFMVIGTAIAVSAETVPYSANFESKDDMLTALSKYAENFPEFDGLSFTAPEDYHLTEKELIIPTLDSTIYTADCYSFAEAFYGKGVNYSFVSYNENDIRFIVYYYTNEDSAYERVRYSPADDEGSAKVHRGYNYGLHYTAYEYTDGNEDVKCTYLLLQNQEHPDKLIYCYTSEPFSYDFLEGIEIESTGVYFPLFEENKDSMTNNLSEEFYNFCNSIREAPSDNDSGQIYDYIKADGMVFFKGDCSWIFEHEMIVCADSLGDWHFMTSPCDNGLSGLGIYVKTESEILTLESAYEQGIVTDLTTASKLEGTIMYRKGDVNGDKALNIKDSTALQKYIANKEVDVVSNRDIRDKVFDMNTDGKVNIKDATAIQKHLAKIDY